MKLSEPPERNLDIPIHKNQIKQVLIFAINQSALFTNTFQFFILKYIF